MQIHGSHTVENRDAEDTCAGPRALAGARVKDSCTPANTVPERCARSEAGQQQSSAVLWLCARAHACSDVAQMQHAHLRRAGALSMPAHTISCTCADAPMLGARAHACRDAAQAQHAHLHRAGALSMHAHTIFRTCAAAPLLCTPCSMSAADGSSVVVAYTRARML